MSNKHSTIVNLNPQSHSQIAQWHTITHCPTCSMSWTLNPPVKCDGSNHFLCIDCKAIYSSEMLAAPDMLAALHLVIKLMNDGVLVRDIRKDGNSNYALEAMALVRDLQTIQAAIAKAEGRP